MSLLVVLVCISMTGIHYSNPKSISPKIRTVLKDKNALKSESLKLHLMKQQNVTNEADNDFIDDPNFQQALMTKVFIQSKPNKRSNSSVGSEDNWKMKKNCEISNDIKRKTISRKLGNLEGSHMTMSLVGNGETDIENFENNGLNMCPQQFSDIKTVGPEEERVRCVKISTNEVLCSHGDYTYRISLPDQYMNQDSIEELVSSIYKNIELGNKFEMGSPRANIFPKQMYMNGKFINKEPIEQPSQYVLKGLNDFMNKNEIKNTLDSNNQLVTFTLPVKMGNLLDKKTLLQPKIQLQGINEILPQNELIASGVQSLPSTENDLQKINVIRLPNHEVSYSSNNSQFIPEPHLPLPNQGGDFQLYPVTLDFNDQSNANNTEDEYSSKWLTRRENTIPSILNVASYPYRVLLLKGKNIRKREADEFTKSNQVNQEKNIKKRVSFKYCPRKFVTTCRCSVNYGRKGNCANELELCPKLKECPCKAPIEPPGEPTTCNSQWDSENQRIKTTKPTRCPCYIPPALQTCVPPSENSTGQNSVVVHDCTEKLTTTELCITDPTIDSKIVQQKAGRQPHIRKKIINSLKKIQNKLKKRSLHSRPKRKHSYIEANLKKTNMKNRRKSKKVRECSCTCGLCNCKKKHKVNSKHFLPIHHNNFNSSDGPIASAGHS